MKAVIAKSKQAENKCNMMSLTVYSFQSLSVVGNHGHARELGCVPIGGSIDPYANLTHGLVENSCRLSRKLKVLYHHLV